VRARPPRSPRPPDRLCTPWNKTVGHSTVVRRGVPRLRRRTGARRAFDVGVRVPRPARGARRRRPGDRDAREGLQPVASVAATGMCAMPLWDRRARGPRGELGGDEASVGPGSGRWMRSGSTRFRYRPATGSSRSPGARPRSSAAACWRAVSTRLKTSSRPRARARRSSSMRPTRSRCSPS
jgi:hypothetical protein